MKKISLKRYKKLMAKGKLQGKLINFIYSHDDWCQQLSGGKCTCKPDLEIILLKKHDS